MNAETLITDHLSLAKRLAAVMARRIPLPREEIQSAAMLGLVQAARAYEPISGSFARFAEFRIKGAILDEARAADLLTRDQRRAVKSGKAEAVEPHHDQFEDVQERIADLKPSASVEDWAASHDFHRHLLYLPRRLQRLLRRRFVDDASLAAIGAELGVTDSRVCQLLTEAKERLRVRMLPVEVETTAVRRHRGTCKRGHLIAGYNAATQGPSLVCRRCRNERQKRSRWARGTMPLASFRQPPHKLRKLHDYQVKEILAALMAGERRAVVARRYRVSPLVVGLIRDGKTYRDVLRPTGYVPKSQPIGKLTSAQAQEIRRRLKAGVKGRDLAVEYGLSEGSVSAIRRARYHRGGGTAPVLEDARHRPSPTAKLTEEQVRDVRERLAAKESIASLARRFDLSWSTIRCLRDGRTYARVA